ncbi:DNA repair protein, partial [Enterococcus faecalis]|nr:DNA repair protein [Enterococcus faecalis]
MFVLSIDLYKWKYFRYMILF